MANVNWADLDEIYTPSPNEDNSAPSGAAPSGAAPTTEKDWWNDSNGEKQECTPVGMAADDRNTASTSTSQSFEKAPQRRKPEEKETESGEKYSLPNNAFIRERDGREERGCRWIS